MSSSTSLDHSASLSPASASASASESSHDQPSEPRISISSTIYPTSSNNPSFDIARYPASPMPATNSDRESFIDLASPTFSPLAAEFSFNSSKAPAHEFAYPEQSIPPTSVYSSESLYGKPSPRAPSPSNFSKPRLPRLVPPADRPAKPPIPTDPKPDFSYRSRSGNRASPVQGRKQSPLTNLATDLDGSLPTFSASNALTPKERAERIRTTRKLAQVFGLPPGVSPVSQSPQEVDVLNACMPMPGPLNLNLPGKRRHHKPTASMSDDVANSTPVYGPGGDLVWPPPDSTRYVHLAPRRHSAPLSPDGLSFIVGRDSDIISSLSRSPSSVIEVGSVHEGSASETSSMLRSRRGRTGPGPGSPMSFIDLSDEEAANDTVSESLVETPKASRGRHPFASTASLDSVSSDQLAEEERRRKREKLAKLHRFLGSRVPTHLVLGPLDEGSPLPPPTFDAPDNAEADIRKVKMRRRRSSSAAEFSRKWSDDIDRLKEELNEREKAINVRRAVKMEKMFGVAPPQTLYHTRAPVASSPNIASVRQPSPSLKNSPRTPATPPFRFTTAGPSSKAKGKSKRPGTSDSSQPLIDDGPRDSGLLDISQSSVYIHYRHSLNSLNDIIDRDDKESLAELHDYITGDHYKTGEQYDYQFAPTASVSGSNANARSNTGGAANSITSPLFDELAVSTPTAKSERRRSLPSRVSIASFTSEISMIYAPTPTEGSFQQRRRRAAKLTHFFGVDYRDLMSEILDSIEKGLEEERGKGTLKPDEVKDLQQKLVSLKTKRNSLLR
ncbi:hypothetical protein C8Q74DRAFT_1191832 [Fomes fomentarius]|nr:hypothetical protein C8Q74DRAFT_1191832 [Fomes fomentarius]